MAQIPMGLGPVQYGGLCKVKWRWLFKIPQVCGEIVQGVSVLPPLKSARPDLKWKEMNIQHLSEEVFFPSKPDWSTVALTLYDIKRTQHPVFAWLRKMYNPQSGEMYTPNNGFIKTTLSDLGNDCQLILYDGCGNPIETWIFEDAWPQQMNFNDLDMGTSEIVLCNLVLRFARAYIVE